MKRNKNLKIDEFIRKYKKLFILLLLVVLISPIPIAIIEILYQIGNSLDEPIINTVFEPQDILNYFGVIIGAVVTFCALYVTIKSEKNERKEDRRQQVYPYLRYEITNNFKLDKTKPYHPILVPINTINYTHSDLFEFNFRLTIENIGINSLINFSVLEIETIGVKDNTPIVFGDMKVSETKKQDFLITMDPINDISNKFNEIIENGITIKVSYSNLVGDYYKQNINISVYEYSREFVNKKISLEYNASIKIHNISKPIFIDDKDIFREK